MYYIWIFKYETVLPICPRGWLLPSVRANFFNVIARGGERWPICYSCDVKKRIPPLSEGFIGIVPLHWSPDSVARKLNVLETSSRSKSRYRWWCRQVDDDCHCWEGFSVPRIEWISDNVDDVSRVSSSKWKKLGPERCGGRLFARSRYPAALVLETRRVQNPKNEMWVYILYGHLLEILQCVVTKMPGNGLTQEVLFQLHRILRITPLSLSLSLSHLSLSLSPSLLSLSLSCLSLTHIYIPSYTKPPAHINKELVVKHSFLTIMHKKIEIYS